MTEPHIMQSPHLRLLQCRAIALLELHLLMKLLMQQHSRQQTCFAGCNSALQGQRFQLYAPFFCMGLAIRPDLRFRSRKREHSAANLFKISRFTAKFSRLSGDFGAVHNGLNVNVTLLGIFQTHLDCILFFGYTFAYIWETF